MSIKAVLFDLDGTLLPMDQEVFTKTYFKALAARVAPLGYQPEELIKTIWAGTAAMIRNTGEKTNEEVFWDAFAGYYGEQSRAHLPEFDQFYRTDFEKARAVCGFDPLAAEAVRTMKERGYRVALATNPIFPAIATENRIRWAGLEPKDFELFTSYENIGLSKPNPEYFREVARRMGVEPAECLMVGNDAEDDRAAEAAGMQVFFLTACLINKNGRDLSSYPQGDLRDLLEYLK